MGCVALLACYDADPSDSVLRDSARASRIRMGSRRRPRPARSPMPPRSAAGWTSVSMGRSAGWKGRRCSWRGPRSTSRTGTRSPSSMRKSRRFGRLPRAARQPCDGPAPGRHVAGALPGSRARECSWRVRATAQIGPALPVAFAAVCACSGIDRRRSVEAFAYTRLAATVSAAMRLMPLGQTEAHRLLAGTLARVPEAVDAMVARNARAESFAPAMDVAAMSQQYLHSRLFRS